MTAAETVKQIEQLDKKEDKQIKEELLEQSNFFDSVMLGKRLGGALRLPCDYLFLVLPSVKDSWEYWETLAHELHHIVFFIADIKGLHNEFEAQAYLFGYLFKSIRRKLQGIDYLK